MKYTLLKDEKDHFIIHHPAGHVMKVAKQAIPPEMHASIQKLYDGGSAEATGSDQPAPEYAEDRAKSNIAKAFGNENPPAPEGLEKMPSGDYLDKKNRTVVFKGAVGYADGGEVDSESEAEDAQPQAELQDMAQSRLSQMAAAGPQPEQPTSQVPIPPSTPGVPESPFEQAMGEYKKSFEEQRAGVAGEEAAKVAQSQQESPVLGKLSQQLGPLNFDKARQQNEADLASTRAEGQQLQQDIMNNKFDYNRLWSNASTPAKITAGLGLILGGIGAGITGRGNDALSVLNNAINRDVEQQRDQMANKRTLLNYNLQKTGDLRQAQVQTQRQLLDATQAKLSQVATQTQDPLAKARAQQLYAGIDQQKAQLDQQLGLYKMQYQMSTQPFNKEMLGIASPEQSKRAIILPDGQSAVLATDEKSAEDARKAVTTISPLMDSLKQIEKIGTQPIDIGVKAEQVRSLLPTILLQAKAAQGLNRLSPEALDLLKSQLSDPTKVVDLVRGPTRTKTFLKSLENELNTKLQSASPAYKNPNKVPGAVPKYGQ